VFDARDLAEWNITFWTSTKIYGVTIVGGIPRTKLLFESTRYTNITNAVSVNDWTFFTDSYSK